MVTLKTMTSSFVFLKSPTSLLCRTTTTFTRGNWFRCGTVSRRSYNTTIKAQTNVRKEQVVIVGGGIAGLATALTLHRLTFESYLPRLVYFTLSVNHIALTIFIFRLGVGSLVLEQAESLRTGGTSLTLSKNGWRVLDVIGVADHLRTQFSEIQGYMPDFN